MTHGNSYLNRGNPSLIRAKPHGRYAMNAMRASKYISKSVEIEGSARGSVKNFGVFKLYIIMHT